LSLKFGRQLHISFVSLCVYASAILLGIKKIGYTWIYIPWNTPVQTM